MTGTMKEVAGKGIHLTTSQAGAFVHGKVNQVEHENAAVEGAHRTEMLAERGVRGSPQPAKTAARGSGPAKRNLGFMNHKKAVVSKMEILFPSRNRMKKRKA